MCIGGGHRIDLEKGENVLDPTKIQESAIFFGNAPLAMWLTSNKKTSQMRRKYEENILQSPHGTDTLQPEKLEHPKRISELRTWFDSEL